MVVAPTTDSRHKPFMSWLDSCGADIGPIALGKSSLGDGYGAFSTRAIEEGEQLFKIPSAACCSLYTACGDAEVGEVLAQMTVKGQGGATVALAGILAKEWLCAKETGPRGPYLAMLPWDASWPPEGEQEQEHVLWWSESQVDRLEGSAAYADAVGVRDEVALASRVLKSLIGKSVRKAYRERGEPPWKQWQADDDIDKAVRGAFVSILTRGFNPEGSDDEEERLVPLLDMLQHVDDPNVSHSALLDEETGEQVVVAKARRPIAAGEELTNNYDGNKLSPEVFLTRFGFVPGRSVGEFIEAIGGKAKLPFGLRPY